MIYLIKIFERFLKLSKLKIPEPKLHLPLIEFFHVNYMLAKSTYQERFKIITEYAWKYPECVKFWFGPTRVILVNSPVKIKRVLLAPECIEKWNLFYQLMDRNNGLISGSTRKNWKEHRKFFNFSFGLNIDMYRENFEENAKNFIEELTVEAARGKEFDFFKKFKPFAFNILCESLMGLNINNLKNVAELLDAYDM